MKPRLPEGSGYRLLAAGVLLSVASVLAFRLLWVGPRRELVAMRRVELEQSRAEVVRARDAASRLPELEADVERRRRRLAALRRALPGPHEAPALLRGLQGIAARSRLTMEAFTVEATRAGEPFEEWPVRLELTGGFHDLAAFLDEVSRLPRIVTVGRMSIRALAPGTPAATISVTCTATTYVLRESAPAGDASSAPPDVRATPASEPPTGERVLPHRARPYDPDGRRDPFVNPLRRSASPETARPRGLAGVAVDELTLRGLVSVDGAYVAVLESGDGRSHLLRGGETLFDGSVRSVTAGGVVIVRDGRGVPARGGGRTVHLTLRPAEEDR